MPAYLPSNIQSCFMCMSVTYMASHAWQQATRTRTEPGVRTWNIRQIKNIWVCTRTDMSTHVLVKCAYTCMHTDPHF